MRKYWIYIWLTMLVSVGMAEQAAKTLGMRDPTMPISYETPATKLDSSGLALIMTFVSSNGKIAIINGNTYEEGAVVGGFRITKIEQNKVYLVSTVGQQSLVLVPKKNQLIRPVSGVSK